MKALLIAFAGLCAATAADAMVEGRTAQDRPFVSGGVDAGELADLRAKQPFFNLALLTVARSGAHLAGVQVRIVDAGGKPVLETEMDGPLLLVDLLPGSYRLEATHESETQRRALSVQTGRPQRLTLYFRSDAQVSPDLKR
ncbi:MAG: hypothetical protein N2688_08075 [Burkholderiaceae bacterium]|nr:hypothetical protein [Burkholderiaceae bacterium]